MKLIETSFDGVYIIEPKVYGDNRGYFWETWSEISFKNLGLDYNFVQDNHSSSSEKGTIRGIHYQEGEWTQAKLVRCTRGSVLDVIVDLRPESKTFKKWIGIELSEKNKKMIIIPRRMGHGFVTLTDYSEFMYKVDNKYNPKAEGGIIWNDPELDIKWMVKNPILSLKDKKLDRLANLDFNKIWKTD